MNTTQKYGAQPSQTNPVEPTAQFVPSFVLSLRVDSGSELEILRWALLNLREKFTDEAADALGKQDALNYVGSMENIECVDGIIDELFFQLNRVYERLQNIEIGDLARHEDDNEQTNNKVAALNEKYGWKSTLNKP